MKIFIKLIPNSKHSSIEKIKDSKLKVKVTEPAVEGKANKALINSLSDYLDISKSRISIVSGHKSRDKVVSVE